MNVIMNEMLSASKSKRISKSVKSKQKEKMKKKKSVKFANLLKEQADFTSVLQLFFKNLSVRVNDEKLKDEKKKTVTINEINAAEVNNDNENAQEVKLYNLFSVSASRLHIKLHGKKISALLNSDAEINVMIKALVNSLRLLI
ncbi:MAG: hypothetical protein M1836_001412 [Candelina mexicana]|nr:MAG: hypothetical protein M1836_001412 [Candelina mexicana]